MGSYIWQKRYIYTTLSSRFQYVLEQAAAQTGHKAVILIDEYDKPLLDVLEEDLEDVNRSILKDFYGTFKAQTTRHRIMGIVNTDDMQIVFSDTPGVLKPNYKMQEMMLAFSESALADADVLLYVTDVVENPEKNMEFLEKVQKMNIPVLLLINKIDQSNQKDLGNIVMKWHSLLPNAEILPISAKNKFGVDMLLKRIKELLPESPAYFDKDQLTDKPARFFVSEIIREKILLYYDKEIPYSVEVKVESFKEGEKSINIRAIIFVERDSQKGIIIGHQGVALKKVGSESRKALEKFFGKKVFLETFVKVDKDWRSSEKELDSFGYNPQ